MKHCRKCDVDIHGDKALCPLCDSELSGEPDEDDFPQVVPQKYKRNFVLKLISFIAIVIIAVSLTVNLIFSNGTWWSLIVSAAIGCTWISFSSAIIQRKHLFAATTWQLFFISGALVLWDLCIGWKGWSLDYVIPCACIQSMLTMLVISKVTKTPVEEILIYLALDALYGIVPIVFILTGCLSTILPSAVCVCASLISMAALIIFDGKNILYQLHKKFHL